MKQLIIAFVAMTVMAMNANAQNNDESQTFRRMSCFLELTEEQTEPVRISMEQFSTAMARQGDFWSVRKSVARHKKQMKRILSKQQYDKYEDIFNLTLRNNVRLHFARS